MSTLVCPPSPPRGGTGLPGPAAFASPVGLKSPLLQRSASRRRSLTGSALRVKSSRALKFDKEEGDRVDKMEFAKYLDEVLPVMSLQDDRLKEKMEQAPDDATAQRLVGVMMNRTKERLKVEALRDIARDL